MPSPGRVEEAIQIGKPTQLLVEGRDQQNFFETFIGHLRCQGIQVQDFGGVDELGRCLPNLVKLPGFSNVASLGIVRDAERNAAAAFRSVQSALRKAGLSVPGALDQPSSGSPAVRVHILPGDSAAGMLETLLCRSFENEPVKGCIDDFFACVDGLPNSRPVVRRDKARAHAYLATMPEPHVSVGVAAQKRYWDLDHRVFAGIRAFLQSL